MINNTYTRSRPSGDQLPFKKRPYGNENQAPQQSQPRNAEAKQWMNPNYAKQRAERMGWVSRPGHFG